MNVKLIVQHGGKPTQAFSLRSEETILGRRRGCDVRIPSEAVSRRHCLISVREGAVMVEDLASVNGTFVNGRRISGKQLVYPGDRLDVGPVTFVVQYAKSQAGPKSPPVPASNADVPEVELVEDSDAKPLKLVDDSDPGDGPVNQELIAEMDLAGGLQLPEAADLRDILAQMDDPKPKKGKH